MGHFCRLNRYVALGFSFQPRLAARPTARGRAGQDSPRTRQARDVTQRGAGV